MRASGASASVARITLLGHATYPSLLDRADVPWGGGEARARRLLGFRGRGRKFGLAWLGAETLGRVD